MACLTMLTACMLTRTEQIVNEIKWPKLAFFLCQCASKAWPDQY